MNLLLDPAISKKNDKFKEYCKRVERIISESSEEEYINTFLKLSEEISSEFKKNLSLTDLILLTAKSVTLDLVTQGWKFQNSSNSIQLNYNNYNHTNITDEKTRIRNSHLFQRNKQLLEKSVREFINKCERKRLTKNGWRSIISLMRDGRELAEKLRLINLEDIESIRLETLTNTIKPYIQIAEPGDIDEFTGISLLDIWRYFRHTWVTPYKVLPGRSIAILIRDAAVENHPIIGIAALGSSVAQFTQRDSWIGWESSTFVERLIENPTTKMGKYLIKMNSSLIINIYKKDLLKSGILSNADISNPNETIIKKLREMSEYEIEKHRKENKDIFNKLKQNRINGNNDWEFYANTSLYKSKRYRKLSTLLSIRYIFNKYNFKTGKKSELKEALQFASFNNAISQLIRKIKSENVGIKMMDIVVCGALPPYNHLLGGKLVCTLLLSPEVVKFYRSKYSDSVSIIASCMSGKKVKRKQDLVLYCTTSLYGVGSSQYNRIKIPTNEIGDKERNIIGYFDLGFSKGYGSFHFSKETIDLIHHLVGRKGEGRIVNSIFGEGANPLMRKLREGLDLIGFPSAEILKHGNKRILYSVPLAKNFKEVLMGIQSKPNYYISQSSPKLKTDLLVKYWQKRWLLNRIKNDEVITAVEKHTLVYPITHGARVPSVAEKIDLFN